MREHQKLGRGVLASLLGNVLGDARKLARQPCTKGGVRRRLLELLWDNRLAATGAGGVPDHPPLDAILAKPVAARRLRRSLEVIVANGACFLLFGWGGGGGGGGARSPRADLLQRPQRVAEMKLGQLPALNLNNRINFINFQSIRNE